MRATQLLFSLCTLLLSTAVAVQLDDYEYIVVGSGAGGGPLAARLAMAGHRTLLIEAGDDQGQNHNYSVPAYSAKASEDGAMAWNFFVRHYKDDDEQARDFKTSYETPGGDIYTGLDPPQGSKMLGTLYPRTGTLGGCTAHNALIALYPYRSDFEYIAQLTGDSSWNPDNMRKYFVRLEDNSHVLPLTPGHGFKGWLDTETAPLTIPLKDPQLLSLFLGGAFGLGNLTNHIFNLATLLLGDANADSKRRDKSPGYYQTPISAEHGRRIGPRDFVVSVRDAVRADGTKKYPLDVRLQCHVTKVVFDESGDEPRATGVEFVDGAYLYSASPRYRSTSHGAPGSVNATREVIVAGGAYNSPQILKLSGIGPAAELKSFNIPVVVDLPGVGTNLQDHYEVAVQGRTREDFLALKDCTFGFNGQDDPCLTRWETPVLGDRGTYASSGLGVAMLYPSTASEDGNWDTFLFGGPVNFRGYFPGYSYNTTAEANYFTWAILKGHPRNRAGSVTLRSSDPFDVPDIQYNFFSDEGSSKDLQALYEAIHLARDALKRQAVKTTEELPGAEVQTQEDIEQYIKDTAWGHHASSTCPIGSDDDPMAVLDSKFRVRGTKGLRVVDASVYPRIPGTFTAVSTFMVAEKAADDILRELRMS